MKHSLQCLWQQNKCFLFILLGLCMFRWSFADQYIIPSGSMEPTLEVGDRILVNKAAYEVRIPFTKQTALSMGNPKRGDIIVFDFPQDPSVLFVKRLIGLPGDQIFIQNGFVYINGRLISGEEPFAKQAIWTQQSSAFLDSKQTAAVFIEEQLNDIFFHIKRDPLHHSSANLFFLVPPNQYFVMGDNRDNSNDSRYWGFVPKKNIRGKAIRVLWSLDWLGVIPKIKRSRFVLPI